jgi:hypothetical protein
MEVYSPPPSDWSCLIEEENCFSTNSLNLMKHSYTLALM